MLDTIKTKYGKLKWNLFFWLGKESSQDEKGTAAYKAVELDDAKQGAPVQYREVEGHESAEFQAVFKKSGGVRICSGGIASGFNKVDPNAYEPRLFQCKGKRNVLVSQVALESSSLNEGDVFILDCGLTLYRWIGSAANKYEKFKALEVTQKIKDEERGGKATVVILNSGKNDSGADAEPFWKLLGSRSEVKSASEGGSDNKKRKKPSLIEISDASGEMKFNQVTVQTKSGKLERSLLKTDEVYLVDVGFKVYLWVGKGATKNEKKESMKYATRYLAEKKYPDWISVQRVNERAETPDFKELFFNFDPPRQRKAADSKSGGRKWESVEAEALFKAKSAAEEKMVDNAGGKITQWRIEGLKKVEVPKGMYGQFFDGDSYIVLYTYSLNGKPAYIIYFWQGTNSSIDEKAGSALLAREIDDSLGGQPVQVRVSQGSEPRHFMAIFKGLMVVRRGGVASAFKNRDDKDNYDTDGTEMFQVKSQGGDYTRTMQSEEDATALNSGDCFVLVKPDTCFVWEGKGSNKAEQDAAKAVGQKLKGERKLVEIAEGSEPEAFWTAIGGKKEYADASFFAEDAREPRLFQLSANTGVLTADEVFNFTQEDLINDDVMMLDIFSEVYVWIGSSAQKSEQELSLKLALDYAKSNPDGRTQCSVFQVQAGFEPPSFTCHFLAWDPAKAAAKANVSTSGASDAKAATSPKAATKVTADDIGFAKGVTYSLAELQAGTPDRVDPSKKEQYLADEEFQKIFGMDKAAFSKLAKWKQQSQKKKNKLF